MSRDVSPVSSIRLHSLSALFLLSLLGVSTSCRNVSPEAVDAPSQCEITYRENWKASDFKGVRLSPDYRLYIQGTRSPDYEEKSANDAAELFGRLHENPLNKMPDCVSETYRLTWVPSFHRTSIVRFWSSTDGQFVTIKRLDRTPENRNGVNFTENTRRLTAMEWDDTINLISAYDFWNIAPTKKEALPNDGAGWLLEGSRGNQYHTVFRVTPDPNLARIIRNVFALTHENTEIDKYLPDEVPQ